MDSRIKSLPQILSFLGNKWTVPVLTIIAQSDKPLRYSEIERALTDISQKMLSQTLRFLEGEELINRKFYYGTPPQTDYTLYEKGIELFQILNQLSAWNAKYSDVKSSFE